MEHKESTIHSLLKNEWYESHLNNTAIILDPTSYLLLSKFEDKIKNYTVNFWRKHTNQIILLVFIIVSSKFFIYHTISLGNILTEYIYGYYN